MGGSRKAVIPPHPKNQSDLTTSQKPESQSERVELRRQAGLGRLVREPQGATLVPARFVPQFAAIALADQHAVALEVREFAQLDRHGMLIGQGNRCELWDEARWNERRTLWLANEAAETGLPAELESLTL